MFINQAKKFSKAHIISTAGNRTSVSWVTVRDTYHHTTKDCCLLRFVAVHFLSQLKCTLIQQKVFKSTHKIPRREIEPRSPEWHSEILTAILPSISVYWQYVIAIHFLSQLKCTLIKQKVFKSTHNLPGGDSNPGLLSDSQRYLPLYYRGLLFTDMCYS